MEELVMLSDYFKGKKVLVTGHTGFKGSWLCKVLDMFGSEVYGYSLEPPTDPSLYEIIDADSFVRSKYADVRDLPSMEDFFSDVKPEIVIHMAAQPLVRDSYKDPRYTYETNVMGTVNVLECVRSNNSVRSFLNVTTDKVYENREWDYGYREIDPLNGHDPYSNSKSCSDIITSSYRKSFFADGRCAISTARAGNVIGGGDFAFERIVPDCVRAACSGTTIRLRNPSSIRPYQHVLEPLFGYLEIVKCQSEDITMAGSYNIGPEYSDCITTGELATMFCDMWGEGLRWESLEENGPHEATFLKLDNSLLKSKIGCSPKWNIRTAVTKTIEWTRSWTGSGDVVGCMEDQIKEYAGE
ncbi:MAG: CDP-glucose 4,6-dehydratase [Gammaproteobacteria bacterium]|nr:CDP-glucose 4,6-dehydratase [Gammaproteobacteria bacterium]